MTDRPEPDLLDVRYVSAQALRGERGPRLLRHLLARGADEFSITVMAMADTPAPFADRFEDELARYARSPARRRALVGPDRDDRTREVRLWTLEHASLQRLLGFLDDGLFRAPAGPDGWLEDLTLYRRGDLVLGLVSHQGEGVLRLMPRELAECAALGITLAPASESIAW